MIYEQGLLDGEKHAGSSPETKVMFARIEGKLDGISNFHEDIKSDMGEIKTQTKLTNGRVNDHDEKFASINTGINILVVIITLIIIPLAGWSLWQIVENKESLSTLGL